MKVKVISKSDEAAAAAAARESERLRALLPVYRLGSRFLGARSEEQVLDLLLDTIREQIDTTTVSIMMTDPRSGCLEIAAARGIDPEIAARTRVAPGEGISGRVLSSGTPLLFNRAEQDPEEFAALLTREDISASISFPLSGREGVMGVINLSQKKPEWRYSSSELELVAILSQLTATAIDTIRLLRQTEESVRIRTMFEQYVSPDVARMLLEQGRDLADLGRVRDLTVLFADIRNFTLLVQQLPLPVLRQFLNDFFNLVTEEVYRTGGTLDKFMGDGVLVIYGAPADHDSPADAAVATATRILLRFDRLRRRFAARAQVFCRIGLGIGISCGEMFVGNLGSRQRFDYTVIGMGVNLAQRLATFANGDALLITEPVLLRLRGEAAVVSSEAHELKGIPGRTMTHSLDWRRRSPASRAEEPAAGQVQR